jgi:hypothetical protein
MLVERYADERKALDGPVPARHAALHHVRDCEGLHAFMLKAILSGPAEELIDLAQTNLWL